MTSPRRIAGGFSFDEMKVFSSEVDTGSREENASKQKARSPVLISSEPGRF